MRAISIHYFSFKKWRLSASLLRRFNLIEIIYIEVCRIANFVSRQCGIFCNIKYRHISKTRIDISTFFIYVISPRDCSVILGRYFSVSPDQNSVKGLISISAFPGILSNSVLTNVPKELNSSTSQSSLFSSHNPKSIKSNYNSMSMRIILFLYKYRKRFQFWNAGITQKKKHKITLEYTSLVNWMQTKWVYVMCALPSFGISNHAHNIEWKVFTTLPLLDDNMNI